MAAPPFAFASSVPTSPTGSSAEDTGGAATVDGGYDIGETQLLMTGCELSYNKASTGPALATFHRTDDKTALSISSLAFVENTLLCGPKKFLDVNTTVSVSRSSSDDLGMSIDRGPTGVLQGRAGTASALPPSSVGNLTPSLPLWWRGVQATDGNTNKAYETSCESCPSWDECTNCSISNPNATYQCAGVLENTSSPDDDGTLASLVLDEGYWRASNTSRAVRQCHNEEACLGGKAEMCGGVNCAEGYCASGYTGPCESSYRKSCLTTSPVYIYI